LGGGGGEKNLSKTPVGKKKGGVLGLTLNKTEDFKKKKPVIKKQGGHAANHEGFAMAQEVSHGEGGGGVAPKGKSKEKAVSEKQ